MSKLGILNRAGGLARLSCVVTAFALLTAPALAADVEVTTESGDAVHAGEFVVPLNKSQILRVDTPVNEILVGNSEIADVLALTDQSIYVLGQRIGSTNLTIYGADRQLLAIMDLVVSHDIESLKAKLFEVMPEEDIEVRSISGAVLLTGSVTSKSRLAQALVIAETFAPSAVTNGLTVAGSQQVLLQVRFAEVNRVASRALGLNQSVGFADETLGFNLSTGAFAGGTIGSGNLLPNPPIAAFAGAAPFALNSLIATMGKVTYATVLDALEQKSLARVLAEPNLVAMSGDTASFLAGGEFPIPVDQESGAITVEFKPFGVGLSFTPTVLGNGLINMIVAPEVSELNFVDVVAIAGGVVPSVNTSRAETTIELRDGQSFAIAGLLQNNYSNSINQYPWVAEVPIIGALFRSANFQRSETELVIVVTPRLVKPAASPDLLRVPGDNYVAPNDWELFFWGQNEAMTPDATAVHQLINADGAGGGIAGEFGHIIK